MTEDEAIRNANEIHIHALYNLAEINGRLYRVAQNIAVDPKRIRARAPLLRKYWKLARILTADKLNKLLEEEKPW